MRIAVLLERERSFERYVLVPLSAPKDQLSEWGEPYLFQIGPTLYAFELLEKNLEEFDQVFVPFRASEAMSMVNDAHQGGEGVVHWRVIKYTSPTE